MKRAVFTAIIHREEDMFVAKCPELGVVSQGEAVECARDNLKEAVELWLECEDSSDQPSQRSSEFFVMSFDIEVRHPLDEVWRNARQEG